MIRINWLDKLIGFVSPERGYKRMAYRSALGAYDAGNFGRLNSGWMPASGRAQQLDKASRDLIRARARDLERNADVAEAIVGPLVRNVVGTGIRVQAKIEDNEELNEEIELLWKEWCKARNCDVTGTQSFHELQRMAMRRLAVDGGIIFIKAYTEHGIVPFSLQAVEVDDLDISKQGERIVDGIEYDPYNRPIAYWFKRYSTQGHWLGECERVEAQSVIFLWDKTRPSQLREISPLARAAPRIRDINEFVEAVAVKERILACLSVFIKKQSPSGGVGRQTPFIERDGDTGYRDRTISPGMIYEMRPGDDVATVNPSGQASNAREFIITQQRLIGAGQGLSYEAVARDLSEVNYSSARQGLLEDQRTYGIWQQFLIEHFCSEVYTEFVISAVLSGQLNIKDFWQRKRHYLKHEWTPPGWRWIDPIKEVNANRIALETGQDTLASICAERGEDWREIMQQRARERELAKELGLTGSDEN